MPDARVLDLARRLSTSEFDELADRLEAAWRPEVKVFALEVDEREAILRVLEDGPDEFGELRAVLLHDHGVAAAGRPFALVNAVGSSVVPAKNCWLRIRSPTDAVQTHPRKDHAGKGGVTMRRFEYRVIDTGQDIETQLNELGNNSWEIVGVTTKKQLLIAPPAAIILMRELQPVAAKAA